MSKKPISVIMLTIFLTFSSLSSAYAGTYKRTFGFILAAVVSGAVSGFAAEVTDRYIAKRSSIHGDSFVINHTATGYSMAHQGKEKTYVYAGEYPIVSRGVHDESGMPYIIINHAETDDDLIIFTERA